jgi:hypothetical protein
MHIEFRYYEHGEKKFCQVDVDLLIEKLKRYSKDPQYNTFLLNPMLGLAIHEASHGEVSQLFDYMA